MAGFNEVGKSAVAELVSVIAIVGTLFSEADVFPAGVVVGPQQIRPLDELTAVGGFPVGGFPVTVLTDHDRFGAGTVSVGIITITATGVFDEGDVFYAGALSGGTAIIVFDPAASEQVTRAMRSSVVMRSLWRAKYAVNGVEAYSDWTPIGETIPVPRGAVYVASEYDGEVISGGPWRVPGGGPMT